MTGKEIDIKLNDLISGIYYVDVFSKEGRLTQKLVIE
jgi:hypothetical protein